MENYILIKLLITLQIMKLKYTTTVANDHRNNIGEAAIDRSIINVETLGDLVRLKCVTASKYRHISHVHVCQPFLWYDRN